MEMMGGSIEEYKKRLNKSLKQPKGTDTANKSGGKSPARLAAEKKKAKLMSEVGTNKTKTKSVLGVTDFAKKPKKAVGNKDMRGGNRDPKVIPTKNTLKMNKIASDAKKPAMTDMPKPKPDSVKSKAKKGPIVTKEQLEKSGLSLRDYMNMMQGKTRRDKKGPEMSDKAFEARRNNPKKMMGGGMLKPKKKMMGGGMTKIKYRGGGIVKQGVRPTRYI